MRLRHAAAPLAVFLLAAGCGCSTAPTPQPPKPRTFNLSLRITGSPNSAATTAVRDAERKLESFITADIPDVSGTSGLRCGGEALNTPSSIDDLFIAVKFVDEDGPGGVLASAGPCQVRGGSRLPVTGIILIDRADVGPLSRSGQLDETILHEMTHVLGLGTIWDRKGLVRNGGTSRSTFGGSKANAQWKALGGSGSVPLETGGGGGTQDGHWSEATLGNELMTGYINSGSNPFSKISVASLGDVGYSVNTSKADSYSIPGNRRAAKAADDQQAPDDDQVILGPDTEVLLQPEGVIG